MRIPFLLFN